VDNSEQLTCLSLCTGYGGIELGLERAGIRLRPVAYVEREAFAAANMVAKIEAGEVAPAPVWTDVKTFPYADFYGRVGIMLAGYPCQPFSAAGQRKGAADERHLWPYIADGIAACQPRLVFCENVEGHLSLGIKDVFNDLDRLGYSYTAGLFSAEEVGATHRRKRLFWLAELADSNSKGLEGMRQCSPKEGRKASPGYSGSGGFVWPAGPGQPQHGWEEPRTVGNNAGGAEPDRLPDEARPDVSEVGQSGEALANNNCERLQNTANEQRHRGTEGDAVKRTRLAKEGGRQTESELGGTTDGPGSRPDATANRVDRLRLLGNGVVPQTAAKAFTTLWQQLKN
jgi:DNA (cytosine-5)-methyltransferase 1